MADNNILTAKVELQIDSSKATQQAEKAAQKLQAQLEKNQQKTVTALNKSIESSTKRVVEKSLQTAEKIAPLLQRAFTVGTGLGASSIYAFLKSGSVESLKFSNSLDRVKVAWSKVGEKLATKIKFGDKTGAEWLEVLVDKLENIDTAQIEKVVGYIKAIGISMLAIRSLQIAKPVVEMGVALTKILSDSNKLSSVGNLGQGNSGSSGLIAGAIAGSALAGSSLSRRRSFSISSTPGPDEEAGMAEMLRREDIAKAKYFGAPVVGRYSTPNMASSSINLKEMQASLSRLKGNAKNPYSYGVVAGSVASAGYSIANDNSASNVRSNSLKLTATVLGTALAGPIGGVITAALAEGADLLSKALIPLSERGTFKSGVGEEEAYRARLVELSKGKNYNQSRKDVENMFIKGSSIALPNINEMQSAFGKVQAGFGGNAPLSAIKGFQIPMEGAREALHTILDNLTKTFDNTDLLSPLRATLKGQIDKVNTTISDIDNNLNDIVSAYRREKEYRQQVAKEQEEFAKALKEFDKNAEESLIDYTLSERKILGEDPKALRTSVSTGGALTSVSDTIAQTLNEQDNLRREKENEQTLKMGQISDMTNDWNKQWNKREEERKKFEEDRAKKEEERIKREEDDRKTIRQWLEEIKNYVTGGSSTTLNT